MNGPPVYPVAGAAASALPLPEPSRCHRRNRGCRPARRCADLGRCRPAELAAAAIDAAAEWLRIGGGYDHPFGQDHPQDRVRAAREIGDKLTAALALRQDLSAGNRERLRSAAARFDVAVSAGLPPEFEIFFTDVEAGSGNWLDTEKALIERIGAAMDGWATEDPVSVVARLILQP